MKLCSVFFDTVRYKTALCTLSALQHTFTNELWGSFSVLRNNDRVMKKLSNEIAYVIRNMLPKDKTAMKPCLRISHDLLLPDVVLKAECNMWPGLSNFGPRHTRETRNQSSLSLGAIGIFLASKVDTCLAKQWLFGSSGHQQAKYAHFT